MTRAILAIIFILLLFFSSSLQRVFYHQSPRDLKRRARKGESAAGQLYKLAAHGDNLQLLLWVLIVASAAPAFVFVGELLSFWPALVLILAIVWLSFVWLPGSRVSRLELMVIGWSAAPLAWLLDVLHSPLARLASLANRWRSASFHTGLYDRDDLLDLLEVQQSQPENQIDPEALEMAIAALAFGDKHVEDAMLPRRVVKSVSASDDVSPVLISELHKTGQTRFVVYQDKPDNIVGTLYLDDLIDLKKSGRVSTLMNHKVCYVHEDFQLRQVLDAFHKTQQHLFVVVNKFEDFVGIITLEDVLAEIVGSVTDEFDDYHDRRAVAENEAAAKHITRGAAGTEPEAEHTVEVVE